MPAAPSEKQPQGSFGQQARSGRYPVIHHVTSTLKGRSNHVGKQPSLHRFPQVPESCNRQMLATPAINQQAEAA